MSEAATQDPTSTSSDASTSTGGTTGSFHESLSEDIRDNPTLKDIKDVNTLAKSYIDAQSYVGSSVRIPGEDASDEAREEFYGKLTQVPGVVRLPKDEDKDAWSSFYTRLGKPESAMGYKYELPESEFASQEALVNFHQEAFDLNLTNSQVKGIVSHRLKELAKDKQVYEDRVEGTTSIMKKEWGADYENRLAGAKSMLRVMKEKFPDFKTRGLDAIFESSPIVQAVMSELGEHYKEQGHVDFKGTNNYGVSPNDAKIQIEEIRANKKHPFHSGDPEAVKKMQKLYEASVG